MPASDNLGPQWQMPNPVSNWTSRVVGKKHAVIDEDVAYEQAGGESQTDSFPVHPMKGTIRKQADGRWSAEVYRPHDYDEVGGSWAEGSLAIMENRVNERLGDYRTEKRAKIAATAMMNRRNEGRNYRTGRGIAETGPGAGGRPY